MWDPDHTHVVTDYWDAALIPDDLPNIPAVDNLSKAETVTQLDSSLFPQRTELLAWSVSHGLILIHQGGGGLAILQAYADSHKTSPCKTLWTAAERSLFAVPESWPNSMQIDYDSSLGRPYPPFTTTDQRFAVFSSPSGVAVFPLCELAGWAVDPGPKPIPLVELGGQRVPEWLVAAPPVFLESRDHDGRYEISVGLLFIRRGLTKTAGVNTPRFYWKVIDLNANLIGHQKLTQKDFTEWEPLPIEGGSCQPVSVRSRQRTSAIGLVFATPRGMWVGTVPYDQRHSPLRISPLNLTPAGNHTEATLQGLMLNAEVERRNFLRWERILCRKLIDSVETQQVVLWFAERAGTREGIYKVITFSWPEEGKGGPSPTVSVVEVSPRAIVPVGLGQRNGIAQMFFLMDRGALYSHQVGEQLRSEHGAFLPDIEQVSGIQLIDPLLISVARISRSALDEITVRSIRTIDLPPRKFGPFRLEADPLYWNGHLFVCERRDQQIHVLRITIVPRKSPSTNS